MPHPQSVLRTMVSNAGRILSVDEAYSDFEEEFLTCQVCQERFDQNERMPKALPCLHTFCLHCIEQIFVFVPVRRLTLLWAEDTLDGALKCPACREEIILSKNKIKELPNDHRVLQMMDFLSQTVAESQSVCSKHKRRLNFFCKKCLVPVCRDCTVLDHKESDGHNIIDVTEALSENSTQLREIENQSRETLQKIKSRSDSLANALKRLDIAQRCLKNEIKEYFTGYHQLLEQREEALTSMVQQMCEEQRAKINSVIYGVCEKSTRLQTLYDAFNAAHLSHNIRMFFISAQQMKDHEKSFREAATQDDSELLQSFEFEAQNEASVLSHMSTLGEVRKKSDHGDKNLDKNSLSMLGNRQQQQRLSLR